MNNRSSHHQSDYFIDRLDRSAFLSMTDLPDRLTDLIAPAYEKPDEQITPSMARATHLFLARYLNGDLVGCFFIARENAIVSGEVAKSVYLGLSAVNPEHRGRGLLKRLIMAFIDDARLWEICEHARLVLWGKTPNPVALRLAGECFEDLEPGPNGEYTTYGHAVAEMARNYYGLREAVDGEHPFLLRQVSKARYSTEESARIASTMPHEPYGPLFMRLGVDQTVGDRLVVFCRVP